MWEIISLIGNILIAILCLVFLPSSFRLFLAEMKKEQMVDAYGDTMLDKSFTMLIIIIFVLILTGGGSVLKISEMIS